MRELHQPQLVHWTTWSLKRTATCRSTHQCYSTLVGAGIANCSGGVGLTAGERNLRQDDPRTNVGLLLQNSQQKGMRRNVCAHHTRLMQNSKQEDSRFEALQAGGTS